MADFDSYYTVEPNTGCWLWFGARNSDGYGHLNVGGRLKKAHRISFEKHYRPLADGEHVLHSCDVPECVNPEHLRAGSHADNMRDRRGRGKLNLAKLDQATADQIRVARRDGSSVKQLALKFGITESNLYKLLRGETWYA